MSTRLRVVGLWGGQDFDQVARIKEYARNFSKTQLPPTQISAAPLVCSMEVTDRIDAYIVEQITILDVSPDLVPPALPLPGFPIVSDCDGKAIAGDRKNLKTLTFSSSPIHKVNFVVWDLGVNSLADVERVAPLIFAAFPKAISLDLQVMEYPTPHSIVSVTISPQRAVATSGTLV
jgi:hypothetical protein